MIRGGALDRGLFESVIVFVNELSFVEGGQINIAFRLIASRTKDLDILL